MAKFNLQKGDKIKARRPSAFDENNHTSIVGEEYGKTLAVSKIFPHGVRTKEYGYVHNNNILSKEN